MFFTCSKCSWCLASSVVTTLASSSSPALSLNGEHALSTTFGRGCWQNINCQLDHSNDYCFLYLYSNHYLPNAPNPFKSASSERTISVRCVHLNALYTHVEAQNYRPTCYLQIIWWFVVRFMLQSLYPIRYICMSWIAVSSLPVIFKTLSVFFMLSNWRLAFHFLPKKRLAVLCGSLQFVGRNTLSAHSNVKPHSLYQVLLLQEFYLWRCALYKNFLAVFSTVYTPLCKELWHFVTDILDYSWL